MVRRSLCCDNPVQNIYIRRVERQPNGRLENVVLQTYPNVSQFWTYNPAEYLKGCGG